MRRKDREVTEAKELEEIIKTCKVLRVAVDDGDGIYIFPVNFGYSYSDNAFEIYFHGAKEGKKAGLFSSPINVGFEMDCDHGLKEGDKACAYGFRYASIVGKGQASIITDVNEKISALKLLMQQQTGKSFEFDQAMAGSANVYKITATSYAGKRCR